MVVLVVFRVLFCSLCRFVIVLLFFRFLILLFVGFFVVLFCCFVVCCWLLLFVVCYYCMLLFVVCCLLLFCWLLVIVACRFLCVLFLFVVCCLLFVVGSFTPTTNNKQPWEVYCLRLFIHQVIDDCHRCHSWLFTVYVCLCVDIVDVFAKWLYSCM